MVRLFGGELNLNMYCGLDRWALGVMLDHTGKPHGQGIRVDYTDWAEVDSYAAEFAQLAKTASLELPAQPKLFTDGVLEVPRNGRLGRCGPLGVTKHCVG